MARWFVSVPTLLVVCAATSDPAQAADPGKGAFIYGAGTQSCGTWLEHRANAVLHNNELNWVLGFLTASARWGPDLRETDANAVAAWIDKYCRENPLA